MEWAPELFLCRYVSFGDFPKLLLHFSTTIKIYTFKYVLRASYIIFTMVDADNYIVMRTLQEMLLNIINSRLKSKPSVREWENDVNPADNKWVG